MMFILMAIFFNFLSFFKTDGFINFINTSIRVGSIKSNTATFSPGNPNIGLILLIKTLFSE